MRVLKKLSLFSPMFILLMLGCSTIDDDTMQFEDLLPDPDFHLEVEKYMSLSPSQHEYNAQGGACYGQFFVQAYLGDSYLDVYDVEKKKFYDQIVIGTDKVDKRFHNNTISFGAEKIHELDYFPVLYTCSGATETITSDVSTILVFRIIGNPESDQKDNLEAIRVQTIKLKGFGKNGWTEAVVDSDHGVLWVKSSENGQLFFSEYKIPSLDYKSVVLNKDNALSVFSLPRLGYSTHYQGGYYWDNYVFLLSGVPSYGEETYLYKVNVQAGRREKIVNLFDQGLINQSNRKDDAFEPESIFRYDNHFMIAYRRSIYILRGDL